ncbi:bifunctional RNase H/acid phosphatase [Janibacter sp. YIM B02568]|uniref:bifunctional RNase H/acid phosphatase n=1 Tax=Janibacter endophyticus TaxID=2806261 RepID=UPI00195001AF|nr:bifunctional RNase H/acid phosphatase [Janibacter endophyticus]MBM6546619.1 bifunctional RNase H/acid phosphatase [Janibacter endophyticus]
MQRRLRVEADGGSRGNPGVAGYGALVRDRDSGELLVELAEPLGKASNNVAEYRGMIAGLDAVREIDPGADVEVAMDSKLVVEQMSGRWKIKHADMRALALEARDIVADLSAAGGSVRWTWIPRAENSDADALSNRGMDGDSVADWHTEGATRPDGDISVSGTAPAAGIGLSPEDLEPSRDTDQLPVRPPARQEEPTRVVLVRHGVTRFTLEARLDGRGGADPGLAPEGHAQAEAAARAVTALVGDADARVVTSSLQRARETGAHVAEALGVSPSVDAEWDEQSFGEWDGASVSELVERDRAAFRALRDDPRYAPPGGESHEDLVARVVPAWESLVAEGGTVVVVCHRKPILVVLAHVLGLPHERIWRLAGAPGSLTALEAWPGGEAVVAFTNRT